MTKPFKDKINGRIEEERIKYMKKNICPFCSEADCNLWDYDDDSVLKCPI